MGISVVIGVGPPSAAVAGGEEAPCAKPDGTDEKNRLNTSAARKMALRHPARRLGMLGDEGGMRSGYVPSAGRPGALSGRGRTARLTLRQSVGPFISQPLAKSNVSVPGRA